MWGRIAPEQAAEREAAAVRRLAVARRFDLDQWGYVVETANQAPPAERDKRRRYCARAGRHDWVKLPLDGVKICRRCWTSQTD